MGKVGRVGGFEGGCGFCWFLSGCGDFDGAGEDYLSEGKERGLTTTLEAIRCFSTLFMRKSLDLGSDNMII